MGSYFRKLLPPCVKNVRFYEYAFESIDRDKFTNNNGMPDGIDNCNFKVDVYKIFPRIACLMINYSSKYKDEFFSGNAINSFKKWHSDIELLYITNHNYEEYKPLDEHDNKSIVRVQIIRDLLKTNKYHKIIMLGLDTITCARLDEFIDDNMNDVLCTAGPSLQCKTLGWESPLVQYLHPNQYNTHILEYLFINADVCCFNTYKGAKDVVDMSLKFYSEHAEQGCLNYCMLNRQQLGLNIDVIDFPYLLKDFTYNVKSKGIASGGDSMVNNIVTHGYKGSIVGFVYPTSEYYTKNKKLFTQDHKHIKVFHYAEGLGCKSDEERNKIIHEIKTIWFNQETIDFFKNECGCNFPNL